MDWPLLEPWMLQSDWRDETRPFLCVDLANWPADLPIDPLPPIPVIGLGPAGHHLAHRVDVIEDEDIALASVVAGIMAMPRAAATLVDLLRAIEGIDDAAALTAESLAYAALQAGAEHRAWRASRPAEAPAPPGEVSLDRDGDRLDILLDRADARNAIDRPMRDALFDAFTLAGMDTGIACVRLRGAGRCFSVGADLSEFGTTPDPVEAHRIRALTLPARALVRCAARVEAHVQGGCVGSGLELAAFAGRLTASASAWFQLPEVGMGILPGAGGCVSIPRRIGRQRAAALMLSGKRIGARTALRWGLIDDIAADDGQADMIG